VNKIEEGNKEITAQLKTFADSPRIVNKIEKGINKEITAQLKELNQTLIRILEKL